MEKKLRRPDHSGLKPENTGLRPTDSGSNVAAQWAFHNAVLGSKQQVVAQYGDDSDEAQAVGLTKKSERAKPANRTTVTAATKTAPAK